MIDLMEKGADVVYGQRITREAETWFKRASASLFYRLLSRYSTVRIPRDTGDFRLMNRRVVDALMMMPERQRFIRGMVSWIGGRQVALVYHRQARFAGESKYPLFKMVVFAADALTSFSASPLRLASYLGFASALLALGLLAYTLISWAVGATVAGWASLTTIVTFFGSVQLIVLGILGEYVGRLFQEAKQRPGFLIDQVITSRQIFEVPVEYCSFPRTMKQEFWRNISKQMRDEEA
jgi:dolichol-phosphate mannosyltransferase